MLEKQLVKLSTDIEDKVKAIEIIQIAIKEEENRWSTHQVEINSTYRVQLEFESERYKSMSAEAKEEHEITLQKKDSLSIAVQQLLTTKQIEEAKTESCLKKIEEESNSIIEENLKIWKRGKKDRYNVWMKKKVQEVEKATIKALEPGVKKLMQKHQVDVDNIKKELETRKMFIIKELEIELNTKLSEFTNQIMEQNKGISEREKNNWRAKLTDAQKIHTQEMVTVRRKLELDNESQVQYHSKQLQNMEDEHHAKVKYINLMKEKDIQNSVREFHDKKEFLVEKNRTQQTSFETTIIQKKKNDLEHKLESEISTYQKETILMRNSKIDSIIRSVQQEEEVQEQNILQKAKIEKELTLKEYKEKFESISNQIRNWKDRKETNKVKIDKVVADIEKMCQNLDLEREHLQLVESKISECRLLKLAKDQSMLENINRIKVDEHEANIKREEEKKNLSILLNDLRETQNKNISNHKVQMNYMIQHHQEILDEMEKEVRRQVETINSKLELIEQNIVNEKIRIQRKAQIIINYKTKKNKIKSVTEQKIHITKSRKNMNSSRWSRHK